jgi:hypothetical protein
MLTLLIVVECEYDRLALGVVQGGEELASGGHGLIGDGLEGAGGGVGA